jgi:hypothetical protein
LDATLKAEAADAALVDEYHARRAKLDDVDEAIQTRVDATKRKVEAASKRFEEKAAEREKLGDKEGARQIRRQATLARSQDMRGASLVQARCNRALAMDRVKLGDWCDRNGLKTDAVVEYTLAVHLNPHLQDAWHHLGYIRHDGRWISPDDAQADRDEAKAQATATKYWEPLLKRWKGWLSQKANRTAAQENFAKVNDPRAIDVVRRVLITPSAADQTAAVKILSAIDRPASSRILAYLAVYSAHEAIRADAVTAVKARPARDYVADVVGLIRTPASYQFRPVQGPGSRGVLVVNTPRFELERSYDAPVAFTLSNQFYGYVGYDGNGLPVAARGRELTAIGSELIKARYAQAEQKIQQIEARTQQLLLDADIKAAAAQQQLAADVTQVEWSNAQATQVNSWAADVLKEAIGAPDLKDDEDAWQTWWYDRVGYSYTPPEKEYLSQQGFQGSPPPRLYSCFVAGTLVTTVKGPKAIEAVRPGDRVLSQNTETGSLGFHPVTTVHRNPPSATVRLALDNGEEIVPSIYRRFWLAGRGWALARDLKSGDVVRSLEGRVKIVKVKPGAVVPVFNLDVASDHTYFVGKHQYVVHDNTLPPTQAKVFDVVAGVNNPEGRAPRVEPKIQQETRTE